MAPAISKLTSIFLAEQMVGLLRQIDENVRRIVDSLRGEGAEVQQKVGDLLQKYLTLLTESLRECMYLKNFIEISQKKLEGVKNILNVVLNGTVGEILEDLHLQHYQSNFERRDLRGAYQLIKHTFDVEQVGLPTTMTAAAKEALQDRIQEFRHGLGTVKDRIREVKVEGERCYSSCKAISEKFGTFLREIKETQEAISSLLVEHRNGSSKIRLAYLVALGISILLLATFIAAAVVACCSACAPVVISADLLAGLGFAGNVSSPLLGLSAMTAWSLHTARKKEMERIGTALEVLQKQLAEMHLDADKQKADWEKIETQAEKIVHYINTSQMEETADGLHPSHHGPIRALLDGVQDVLDDSAKLKANVIQFEEEAEQVQQNLRDLSLMDSDAVLATPAETTCESPLQPLHDKITGITKELQMLTSEGYKSD